MAVESRHLTIPNFIEARTAKALRALMLSTNARLGGFVQYHCIQYVTEGKTSKWVAWFNETIKTPLDFQTGNEKVNNGSAE